MDCKQCGSCCKHGIIYFSDKDIARITKRGWKKENFIKENADTGGVGFTPCKFLIELEDNKTKCRIYNYRPAICKMYPLMPKIVLISGMLSVMIFPDSRCECTNTIQERDFVSARGQFANMVGEWKTSNAAKQMRKKGGSLVLDHLSLFPHQQKMIQNNLECIDFIPRKNDLTKKSIEILKQLMEDQNDEE